MEDSPSDVEDRSGGLAIGLLRQLLADESDAIVVVDAQQRLILFSHAAETLFGYCAEEVIGKGLDLLIPMRARASHGAWVKDFAQGPVVRRRMSERNEVTGRRSDSSEFPAEVTISKSTIEGQLIMVATIRETAARHRHDEEHRRAVQLAEVLAEHAADGVMIVDGEHRSSFVSNSYMRLTGRSADECSSTSNFVFIHPDDRPRYERMARYVGRTRGGSAGQEVRVLHKDGTWLWLEAKLANLYHDPFVGGVVVSVKDVTARHEAQEILFHRSHYDAITGLANRELLQDYLAELAARDSPPASFAVFCFDLDRFRSVNEGLGSEAGDEVLRGVAERLAEGRCKTKLVARLGGDEFAVVCEDASRLEEAMSLAEAFRATLAEPLPVAGMELFLTVSVGVALSRPGSNGGTTLAEAESAMREARATGGNQCRFGDPNVATDALARVQLGAQLRKALTEGQFVAYYQPIVNLANRSVEGVETLVRWRHPERGILAPSEFLPYAEESGLIEDIGSQMMMHSCHAAKRYASSTGIEVGVAVNASARELSSGFLERVERSLESCGLPGRLLTVELTETLLMTRVAELRPLLEELRALGVRLAIDDFGTGYSSLSYLKVLPVETIKIDRSFIAGIGANQDDLAIVSAIISMSHTIGLQVVAEGIETSTQLERLRDLGCDFGQGFFLGRPKPEDGASGRGLPLDPHDMAGSIG